MAITGFISTVWSENLYQSLDKQYIAVANCNRDYEGEIREKGSVVRICGLSPVNVSNYSKNVDMSTPESLTDNYRELIIDQAKYFNFQIDDIEQTQSSPKLMELAMKNAANALANEADRYVYTLCGNGTHSVVNTDVSPENIINSLIDARTKLFMSNVTDPADISFEVSPEIAALILKAKVNLASNNEDSLENGCIGSIAGCRIYVSNNIPQVEGDYGMIHKCIARTKRAISFAEQLSEIDAYRPELRFADAVKGLHLYGAKLVYPDELVQINLVIREE